MLPATLGIFRNLHHHTLLDMSHPTWALIEVQKDTMTAKIALCNEKIAL